MGRGGMRIGIYGLGYVGSVTAAALAAAGHEVVGVDPTPAKVDAINAGTTPVIEPGLGALIAAGVESGRLTATVDPRGVVESTELSFICVGTPSRANGSLDLRYVEAVSQQIGSGLGGFDGYHVVVARSTMLPGSTETVVVPALERASGLVAGRDFGVCFNPEFLREGSSLFDYDHPPFTLIGTEHGSAGDRLEEIYQSIDAELIRTTVKVAEMVKYASNAYHALKVAFANEIGNIASEQGVDSHDVMEIFTKDTKLNVSDAYLKPGYAFGGSCLPKDLRALVYHSRQLDLRSPVLESILPSNDMQIERALRLVLDSPYKRIGVLGMSFKQGTDDLRESPVVELIERLIGKGYEVAIYDENVALASLHGANRAFIETEIPHISSLMCSSIEDLLDCSDVLIVGNGEERFRSVIERVDSRHMVIDLVRIVDRASDGDRYVGISW